MRIPWNKGIKTGIKPKNIFRAGHQPWNKGLIGVSVGWNKGGEVPKEVRKKISDSTMGDKHWNWKGGTDTREYNLLHHRLHIDFGKPNKCENLDCYGDGKRFEYALVHGMVYELKMENFVQLCSACHRRYDKVNGFRIAIPNRV